MILVTGASGNVGGCVLNELLRMEAPVRAMYRSEQDVAKAPRGARAVVADCAADRSSLDRALDGIDRSSCAHRVPQLVELESNMVDACYQRGVRHLVPNSALGAGETKASFPSWHHQVEQRVHVSGVPATILRPETLHAEHRQLLRAHDQHTGSDLCRHEKRAGGVR